MNILPKEQRSDLSAFFRQQAARALREHNKLDRTGGTPHLAGIKWGVYLAYKTSADMLDLEIVSATRKVPVESGTLIAADLSGDALADLIADDPVTLKQPVDSVSYQIEAGDRPTLAPVRVNPHD
jgi:hypothetical protein